jgi:uncharacterized cupin superfamily protein
VVPEARLEQGESGLAAATDGWFVVNVRDATWLTGGVMGATCEFESSKTDFAGLGIRIVTLLPGEPHGLYHRENMQEDFLVLQGECLLLVEGEERPLRAWDFVHSPPGTEHVFVGAGEGPCVLLMTGARGPDAAVHYPVSELALRHNAGVEEAASNPREAYAGTPDERFERPAYWHALPWA